MTDAAPAPHDDLYATMRASPMNEWVGGADPKLAGQFGVMLLGRMLTIGWESTVLDFGCGIGRMAAALLARDFPPKRLVGFDIVPALVDFCRAEIAPRFPAAGFALIAGSNDHYDRFVEGDAVPRPRDELRAEFAGAFTHAYALSVFTHLYADDFIDELGFVRELLAPRGEFLFTAFTLTPFARRRIAAGTTDFPLAGGEFRDGGDCFVGNPADPLGFIAYDRTTIERFVDAAGLVITRVEYGTWMGGRLGGPLQDAYVCRRPES